MLIVNADDLGRSITATNAAITCYRAGRISSTSAMVFMEDSERASRAALCTGLDVGLHVNFFEEFSSRSAPDELRKAQAQLRRFLTSSKYASIFFNPLLIRQFSFVFDAQLAEFNRLYGQPPSHLDGHHHMHLATNILVQGELPRGAKVRRSFTFHYGEKSWLNRCYRSAVNWSLKRRYRVTDHFFSLADHLTPERLQRVISLAGKSSVELMVHPQDPAEYTLLMSDAFAEALAHTRLARYNEL